MSKFIVRPDIDVVSMLKAAGYSTYVIRKSKVLGESTVQKFRGDDKQLPSWAELAKLCDLLHVSPVDLIAFQADDGTVTTFDSIPAAPIVPLQEPIQAAPEPAPVAAPVAPDNLLQVPLSPDMVHNMDGAIRCGYSSDRVQYAIRAINTQIQQDIATEKEKRRSCVRPAYDPYDPGDDPDDDGLPPAIPTEYIR